MAIKGPFENNVTPENKTDDVAPKVESPKVKAPEPNAP